MRMTRRNVLVGLGTIVAGGGGVLASGAYTSVSADRDVSITVGDDNTSDAGIQLSANGDTSLVTNDSSSGDLTFSLGKLNDNATLTINPAFTATSQMTDNVGIRIRALDSSGGSEVSGFSFESANSSDDLSQWPVDANSGSGGETDGNLTNGDSVTVNMTVDTENGTPGNASVIEIEARTDKYYSSQ